MSVDNEAIMAELRQLREQIALLQAERDLEKQRAERAENTQRPTNLMEFLNAAHLNLSLPIAIQQNKSLTTKGDKTNPAGKHIPNFIEHWHDFLEEQFKVWQEIDEANPQFKFLQLFDSLHYLQTNKNKIKERLMGSEKDLEIYERQHVESHAASIIKHLYKDQNIAEQLRLEGDVEFENHPNTLGHDDAEVIQRLRDIQLTTPPRASISSSKASDQYPTAPKNTDQIVVYHKKDHERIACMIVEYKPAHKLTLANINAGLHPMDPDHEVINNPTEPSTNDTVARFRFNSERLVAAAICQCFSYMVDSGLMYGYVCTGEAFIFLQIPENPETVYYFLSIPNTSVGETTGWIPESDASNRLHLTAIAQVLILCLRAMREKPRDQIWQSQARKTLKKWYVDYEQMLSQIPMTERKEPPTSAYQPSKPPALSSIKSPYALRSRNPRQSFNRCDPRKNKKIHGKSSFSDSEDDNDDHFSKTGDNDTLTPSKNSRSIVEPSINITSIKSSRDAHQNRPYCTQRCLLGLSRKERLDINCPNLSSHSGILGYHSIDRAGFLKLVQEQLASSLDIDCSPWYIQGSRGAMFKITLTSHGYTVAAKGTVFAWVSDLEHEEKIYHRLRAIQGVHVPVCLGSIKLTTPYFFGRNVDIIHMMMMAYGGTRIDQDSNLALKNQTILLEQITYALSTIHRHRILHEDPLPRNILWNEELNSPLFIDFERSKIVPQKFALLPSPGLQKKRKWATYEVEDEDKENWDERVVGNVKQNRSKRVDVDMEQRRKKVNGFVHELSVVKEWVNELLC